MLTGRTWKRKVSFCVTPLDWADPGSRGQAPGCGVMLTGREFSLGEVPMFWKQKEAVLIKCCEGTKCHWIPHFTVIRVMLHEVHLHFF